MTATLATATGQMYRYDVTVCHDNDDNDFIGHQTDVETFWHLEPMSAEDLAYAHFGTLTDSETDDDGRCLFAVWDAFDQEFDRSAEEWFPITRTTRVEFVGFAED